MAWTSVVFPVPNSPDNPITAGARSWAPRSSPNRLSSLAERRIGGGLELQELIAQHGRQLEIELLGRGLHLLLQHPDQRFRSEEHTSELQSPSVISYAVFCLKKKKNLICITLVCRFTSSTIREMTDTSSVI